MISVKEINKYIGGFLKKALLLAFTGESSPPVNIQRHDTTVTPPTHRRRPNAEVLFGQMKNLKIRQASNTL